MSRTVSIARNTVLFELVNDKVHGIVSTEIDDDKVHETVGGGRAMKTTGWQEKDDRTIREMREYMVRERLDAFIPWKTAHIAYLTNYYDIVHMNIFWEEMT